LRRVAPTLGVVALAVEALAVAVLAVAVLAVEAEAFAVWALAAWGPAEEVGPGCLVWIRQPATAGTHSIGWRARSVAHKVQPC